LIFAGHGNTIRVGSYQISDPLTYWSDGTSGDASCINIKLPIGVEVSEERRALPYYPQYSQISPDQRANYLSWLSAGKKTEICSPGYVFIYFYGLERRVLIDGKDTDIVIPEIQRLLAFYGSEGSVNSYLRNFLTYICGSSLNCSERKIQEFFPDFTDLTDEELVVVLAWFCQNEKSIPWQVAFSIGRKLSENQKSRVLKKVENELKILFERKYSATYPNGLQTASSKHLYKIEYHPASPSLISYRYQNSCKNRSVRQILLPNPLGKPTQFSEIIKIFDNCIESIQVFSRKIQKSNGIMNAEAYCVLPPELKELIPHPDKDKWSNLVDSHKKETFGLVTVGDLCSVLNIEMRDILTPTQSKNLVSAGMDVGFQLIPDQKILGKPYRWNDALALYPLIGQGYTLSNNFYAAAMIFDLAYSVAVSDAPVTSEEMDHLNQNILQVFFTLNELEIQCLNVLQEIRKIQPESFEKLASRLKDHLALDQRITVGKFLIEIAFFDNILTPDEQKALKKAFSSLDIDTITSDSLIAEALSSRNQENPVIIQTGEKFRKGEALPPISPEVTKVIIDPEKVKVTIRNTEEVQKVLVLVFNEDEPDPCEVVEPGLSYEITLEKSDNGFDIQLLPFPQTSIVKLESRYYPILYEILKLNNLNMDEFDKIVRNFGCMPQATVQEINTWSDEEFGDFLLEDNNGTIIVNSQNILQ
jgi:uncharacterized tellurite resistance protein B-like protein